MGWTTKNWVRMAEYQIWPLGWYFIYFIDINQYQPCVALALAIWTGLLKKAGMAIKAKASLSQVMVDGWSGGFLETLSPRQNHDWLMVWNIFYYPIYWEKSSQLTNILKIVGTTDQGRFLLYKSSTVVTGARCPGPVHSRDFCAHPQSDKTD